MNISLYRYKLTRGLGARLSAKAMCCSNCSFSLTRSCFVEYIFIAVNAVVTEVFLLVKQANKISSYKCEWINRKISQTEFTGGVSEAENNVFRRTKHNRSKLNNANLMMSDANVIRK